MRLSLKPKSRALPSSSPAGGRTGPSGQAFLREHLLHRSVGFHLREEAGEMVEARQVHALPLRPSRDHVQVRIGDRATACDPVVVGQLRVGALEQAAQRSEEHTSELQSLMRISYAVFCLK